MVRLRGSTCALGLEAICLGSVTAGGVGSVCASAASARIMPMSTTIAKTAKVRMTVVRLESVTQNQQCSKARRCITQQRLFRVLVRLHRAPGLVGGVTDVL